MRILEKHSEEIYENVKQNLWKFYRKFIKIIEKIYENYRENLWKLMRKFRKILGKLRECSEKICENF